MGTLTFSRGLLGSELATPWPLDRNKTRGGSYGNHTSFDTNMVIILAALLFTLIGVLGLNSIVRCAMRCTRRFSGVTPAASAADTGLKKGALGEIPVVVYGSALEDSRGSDGECPICLGEFEEGEEVRVLPKCSHSFHVSCIDAWLVSRTSCPVCRDSLLEFPVKMEVAGAQSPENGSDHLGSVAVVAEEGTH